MTPTSRDGRRSGRPFRFAAITAIVVLALLGVLLAGASLSRGPQVRAVTGDTSSTVAQRDVSLVFRADQPLDPASAEGVTVEPATAVQVEVSGASVRVRFPGTLAFATDYRVIVPHLRSQATGNVSATEFAFRTPPLTVTTLERGGAFDRTGGLDAVVRHDVSDGSDATVLTAPRIQEYADADGTTVAVGVDRDGAASLLLARGDGSAAALSLPGRGDVRLLHASSDAGRVGYVFTGTSGDGAQEFAGTLFLADPADPGAPAYTVAGLDGSPVRTDAWQFVPGSAYLVAQTPDRSLLLLDATGAAPPKVLGQLGDLLSFLPGTTSVVVGNAEGLSILDLTSGSVTAVEGTRSLDMAPGSGRVVLSPETIATWSASEVSRTTAGETPAVVARAEPGTRIEEVCASPSGRYLSIGVVPEDAGVDGYPARADRVGRRNVVVDATTGARVGSVEGTRPDWCG
jgi:hypothetical protein